MLKPIRQLFQLEATPNDACLFEHRHTQLDNSEHQLESVNPFKRPLFVQVEKKCLCTWLMEHDIQISLSVVTTTTTIQSLSNGNPTKCITDAKWVNWKEIDFLPDLSYHSAYCA